jgi:membrane-associated phospholipid phosphatase
LLDTVSHPQSSKTSKENLKVQSMLTTLTNLADLVVVLPLAIAILLWLLGMRSTGAALWWLLAVAICIGGTALLKIYFFACPPSADLHSPSGHTSLGTLIYGTVIMFAAVESRGWRRWLVIATGALFVLSIAISRVLLHAHTIAETGVGLLIGGVVLAIFTKAYLSYRPIRVWLQPLILAAIIVIVIFHDHELHAEEFLHQISAYLGIDARLCS